MSARQNKRKQDLESVRALRCHLLAIAGTAADHIDDLNLEATLNSQSAMAAFECDTLGIHSMSLNHLKAMARQAFGSFEILDRARKQAMGMLEAERRRRKSRARSSEASLVQQIMDLKTQLCLLREDMFLLQRAYDLRCTQARAYASRGEPTLVRLCAREQREMDVSISSIRNRRKQSGKVADFRGAPNERSS